MKVTLKQSKFKSSIRFQFTDEEAPDLAVLLKSSRASGEFLAKVVDTLGAKGYRSTLTKRTRSSREFEITREGKL